MIRSEKIIYIEDFQERGFWVPEIEFSAGNNFHLSPLSSRIFLPEHGARSAQRPQPELFAEGFS